MLQAVDRVVRIGQKVDVLVFSVYMKGSLDYRVYEVQLLKVKIAKMVVKDEHIDILFNSIPLEAVAPEKVEGTNEGMAFAGPDEDDDVEESLLVNKKKKNKRKSKKTVEDEEEEEMASDPFCFTDRFIRPVRGEFVLEDYDLGPEEEKTAWEEYEESIKESIKIAEEKQAADKAARTQETADENQTEEREEKPLQQPKKTIQFFFDLTGED